MREISDFQRFIKINKLKQNQVAEYLGTSPQYISQVKKGISALSDDKYELLAKSGWDVSMLKFPPHIKVPAPSVTPYYNTTTTPNRRQTLTQVMNNSDTIITDAESIDMSIIPAEVVEEVKAEIEIAESVPIVPEEIANKPGFNIKEYIENNEDELERINPSKLLQGAELAEKILGASMLPTFAPGDIVFVRFLPDKSHLIDGKTYYFDLKNRPTMIRTVKIEGDTLRLVALHPNFGDIIIHKSEVLNVAKIIGLLRMTFGDQYSEIEAIRTKKEQQIEKLIEHIGNSMAEISKAGARTDRVMEQNAELMRKLLEK